MEQAVIAVKSACDTVTPSPGRGWRGSSQLSGLRRSQCFSSEPAAASAVRRFVSTSVDHWGYDEVLDDLLVCACELATNAQVHGTLPGEQFLVSLLLLEGPPALRIEVHDRSPLVPVAGPVTPHDEDGRGLLLVSALSTRWGVEPRPGGKVVWSELQMLPAGVAAC